MSAADEDFMDDDENNDVGEVQLGFVEHSKNELFANSDWSTWDGGKIGGKPVWLNYEHIPSYHDLQCRICSEPMVLLVQVRVVDSWGNYALIVHKIYCPLDQLDAAFHRSLYVFCCRKSRCIEQGR